MNKLDNRQAFRAAVKAELDKKGFGAQVELARLSGVSKSMVNDIVNGRTFGGMKTRLRLATCLGYETYEKFVDYGKTILEGQRESLEKEIGLQESLKRTKALPSVIELLVENRTLRIELEQTRKQLETFKGSDQKSL
jgi:transcriptional regulator with XRE-family HTH domain